MKKENVILDKSFDFALSIIELYKKMIEQKEYILSKQILRSGTSIGANVEESTAAISKKDFTAKMSIVSKEARETRYWIRLLEKSKLVNIDFNSHLNDIEQLINILTAIVKTSQSKA
ncbi:MAG: four helix bundle protein [Candidatus Scalindua sp.]|jgi:four helix bundle protein|nr:four helix bundle protein [Candidatus Scalindua sp.]MBT6051829.1 four helix bundle protein [Candidatus Scalindua sp.]MBT7211252.1 four helix bundle protein [Candidatus Scalindua sp.]MBT7593021.1 four helix bundle protein [Candidatus Scalindua sp.]